jgi:hypothetical protein
MGIIETIGLSESVLVLHHHFWPLGHVSCLEPLGLHPGVSCMSLETLESVAIAPLEFEFCLD